MMVLADDRIYIPGISFEWVTAGGTLNLVGIVNDILGVALVLCGIYLILSVVAWVTAKFGFAAGFKDSAFFFGGPGSAVLAAVLIGSLAAAMRYGIRIVGSRWQM